MLSVQKKFNMKFIHTLAVLMVFILLSSCNSGSKSTSPEENSIEVFDIYSLSNQEIINKIEAMGMPIYSGSTPPVINGLYSTPHWSIDTMTYIENRMWASILYPLEISFNFQNNNDLTINMTSSGTRYDCGDAFKAHISGFDKFFTIYWKHTERYNTTDSTVRLRAISGKLVENGIEDLKFADFFIKAYGSADLPEGILDDYTGLGTIYHTTYGKFEKID
jgi:hypothetical protein